MSASPTLLTDFQYCVILQHPKRSAQSANADAVAATIVNAVYTTLGPRQTVIQAIDLRTPLCRTHVDRVLNERGLANAYSTTPLFFSKSENVFAKPGLVSLQLLVNAASYLLRRPTADIVAIILAFPQRHSLEFTADWADMLEEAESAEGRMKATPHALPRHRGINVSDRVLEVGHVTSDPHVNSTVSSDSNSGAQQEAMSLIRDSFGAENIGEVMKMGSVTGTDAVFYTGMNTYTDASVYRRFQADVEPGATDTGTEVSVERMITSRLGGLLNGKEAISQTAITGGYRTDPKAMEQEILEARRARVQQTREFRRR